MPALPRLDENPLVDRLQVRKVVFWCLTGLLTLILAGYIWKTKPVYSPNEASRYNTIWSLVEYQTYAFVPQAHQYDTIDRIEIDGTSYSTKPPLWPTLMAGYVWGWKQIVGLPVDKGSIRLYNALILYAFNLLPYVLFLISYRRWLDDQSLDDFAYYFSLVSAAAGTYLTGYLVTLNNHTLGGILAFFALRHVMAIVLHHDDRPRHFLLAGLFAALAASVELPALLFIVIMYFGLLIVRPTPTSYYTLPMIVLVLAAVVSTNVMVTGSWKPAYLQRDLYNYPGSYWTQHLADGPTPAGVKPPPPKSGIDGLNENPESYLFYFFNMTLGHHGLFILTPIWIIAAWGLYYQLRTPDIQRVFAVGIFTLSIGVFSFFWLVTNQRNYGGFCQGMRWLLWLIPFWLTILPTGLMHWPRTVWGQRSALIFLGISIFSMAGAWRNPWTRSWLHEFFMLFGWVNY